MLGAHIILRIRFPVLFTQLTTFHTVSSVLPFVLSFLLVASGVVHAAVDAKTVKKPIVFVHKVAISELSETLVYPARIEPRIRAAVVSDADGVVTKVVAPLGSVVKNRGPLLVIRNTDPVYQYSPMVVSSPVAGIVSRVDVTEGSRVSRGDKLALVTDPAQVRVVVEITARDLRSIQPGMEAELTLPGLATQYESVQDETLLGMPKHANKSIVKLKVKGVSPFVDPATGTAACELEVVKRSKNSRPRDLPPLGTIARVMFRVNERKGFSIPDSALIYRGKDPFVRVVTEGKARLVQVSIGRKQGNAVEILKGLKAGDQVIERTSGFIADNESVEVQSN